MTKRTFLHLCPSIGLLISAFAFLWGCGWDNPVAETGKVVIRIDNSDRSQIQTFLPDVDTEIVNYVVDGENQQNGQIVTRTFLVADVVDDTVVIDGLSPGSWTISISAYSVDVAKTTPLFQGQISDVYVVANQSISETVTLIPIAGNGTLIIEFVFPTTLFPAVMADLTPIGGASDPPALSDDGTAGIFDFTTAGIARYEGSVESGYYELESLLQDGAAILWHNVDALRIIFGYQTTATIDVGTGSIDIVIEIAREDPIIVAISSNVPNPNTSDTILFTALPVGGTAPYNYRWYINGVLQAEPTATLELTSLAAGHYRVSAVVSDGTVLGSAFMAIDVVTAP